MSWPLYLTFVAGCIALVMSPGPDLIFVLSRGLTFGPRGGVIAASSILLGLLTHTSITLLGLAAILTASPMAFQALKWLGVAYLLFLSYQIIRSEGALPPASGGGVRGRESVNERVPVKRIIRQGYLINILNPGALLTFTAYIPQFVPADTDHHLRVLLLLAVTLVLIAFLWFCLAGTFAGAFNRFIQESPRIERLMRICFGSLLLILALGLAFKIH